MTETSQARRRRRARFSVRVRLILAMILAVTVPVLIAQTIGLATGRAGMTRAVDNSLHTMAEREANILIQTLLAQADMLTVLADNKALLAAIERHVEAYDDSSVSSIQALILDRDLKWREADAAGDDSDPLVQSVLSSPASAELLKFREKFPAHAELFITDAYGANVAATNRTTDYYQADEEWWQAAWNQGEGALYIANEVQYDESAGVYSIDMAMDIYTHDTGERLGVLRTTYNFSVLQNLIQEFELGETGYAVLVSRDGRLTAGPSSVPYGTKLAELIPLLEKGTTPEDGELDLVADETGEKFAAVIVPMTTNGRVPAIDELGWQVIVFQSRDEVFTSINRAINTGTVSTPLIAGIGIIAALLLARGITRPLRELTDTAEQLGREGDYSARAAVRSQDEFGTLAQAFNAMAENLQGLVGTLEQRVADRTRDLQTVTDVNAQIATILEVERLLQDVVDLTKERFRLYHAHIYMVDETGQTLTLAAGAGHIGRQMVAERRAIALVNPHSIVALAARIRESMVVNDVTQSETFLPHPLLPDTRSELAVPLVARGQLLGVLDLQADARNAFDEDVQGVMELLSGQIATALSNARLFEAVERTSRHEQAVGAITRRIQEAVDLEDILQVTVRELGKALRVPYTAIELKVDAGNGDAPPEPQPEGESGEADA
jgi:GAF domain-containing protein/HAMP domain-containing protein